MAFGDFAGNNGIVVPEYESIFSRLVPDNAEFGIHIVLHLVVITIQMVRRYIQQDGDVRLEVVHVVELETTQFDHVDGVRIFSHLEGKAVPDVPGKPSIHSRLSEDVVSQHGRRRLAIASGDTDHLGIRVPSGKFYLGDDRRTFLLQFLYDRSLVGNPRTLDNLVGIPTVTTQDDTKYSIVKDALADRFYIGDQPNGAMEEIMRTRIRDTAMTYAKYISEDTRFSDLQQYLYRRTDYYKAISSFVNRYFSTHDSYRFDNMHISDLISYGEDVGFTGTISFDYVVTIEGEKSQTYSNTYQMTFLNVNGKWLCSNLVIANQTQPEAKTETE